MEEWKNTIVTTGGVCCQITKHYNEKRGLFALGLGIGIAIGVALHNVAIGTAVGAGIGVALAGSQTCIRTRKE